MPSLLAEISFSDLPASGSHRPITIQGSKPSRLRVSYTHNVYLFSLVHSPGRLIGMLEHHRRFKYLARRVASLSFSSLLMNHLRHTPAGLASLRGLASRNETATLSQRGAVASLQLPACVCRSLRCCERDRALRGGLPDLAHFDIPPRGGPWCFTSRAIIHHKQTHARKKVAVRSTK